MEKVQIRLVISEVHHLHSFAYDLDCDRLSGDDVLRREAGCLLPGRLRRHTCSSEGSCKCASRVLGDQFAFFSWASLQELKGGRSAFKAELRALQLLQASVLTLSKAESGSGAVFDQSGRQFRRRMHRL